ncbi:unnamed protein product [Gordionus sp. m RMFG-2023]
MESSNDVKKHLIKLQIIGQSPIEGSATKKDPKKDEDSKAFVEYLVREIEHYKSKSNEVIREKDAVISELNSYKLDKDVFSSKNSMINQEAKDLKTEVEILRKENKNLLVNLALAEKENQDDYTDSLRIDLKEKKSMIEKIRGENELLKEKLKDKLDDFSRMKEELRFANESLSRAASTSPNLESSHKPTFKLRIRHRSNEEESGHVDE